MRKLMWWARISTLLALVVVLTSCKPDAQSASSLVTSRSPAGIGQLDPSANTTDDLSSTPDTPASSTVSLPVVVTTSTPPPAPVAVVTTKATVQVTTAAPRRPVTTAAVAPVAPAAPAETVFANCTAMHQVYPHGVGQAGAVDHVSGTSKPVTDFYVDTALYNANSFSDADGDGIACEKN